jgi:uncharacterized phage-associated protein
MLSSCVSSERLAYFILQNAPIKGDLSPLKLQKLLFYTYGAALAFDYEDVVGVVEFEAWKHGPVNPVSYELFKGYKGNPIEQSAKWKNGGVFAESVPRELQDALYIYGLVTPWGLREETHLEQPWIDVYKNGLGEGERLCQNALKAHFQSKFCGNRVHAPQNLVGAGSFRIDGIPLVPYPSLRALADAMRSAIRFNANI